MTCESVVHRITEFLDERLPERDRHEIAAHVGACRECGPRYTEMIRVRKSLRALPKRQAPAHLTASLRVTASREMARAAARRDLRSFVRYSLQSLSLTFDNLMRPFALPAFGGLFAAIILFSALVPSFMPARLHATIRGDVPTQLYTTASLMEAEALDVTGDEIVLELDIDGNGKMVDYSVEKGETWMRDASVRRSIEYSLLLARFSPATTFGQPMSGKVRISFRPRYYIDVKG
ncbi:MAG: zf-HC2 domain-containing protein [Bryobacteraceae bacterium]|nr:zf-HC2 domain-containing protein [Bryobacteraceae bacterium]